MNQKTKATPKDRQWNRTKPGQNSRYQAGGLGKILRTQIEAGECRQLATVGRAQKFALLEYQPFGSMPRLSSSRRNIRLIHPERLSSPSSFMAVFNLSNNSASRRSCTAKRSFLLSYVDIVNLKNNNGLKVTMYTSVTLKTTPQSVLALPRRLTTNDS